MNSSSFDHDDRTYWHAAGQQPPTVSGEPRAHILQILDETYRGYQDSRWVIDSSKLVPRTREKSIGMVLIDAQIAATMRRTIKTNHVRFDLDPYRDLSAVELDAVADEAARYGRFLDLEADVVWAS